MAKATNAARKNAKTATVEEVKMTNKKPSVKSSRKAKAEKAVPAKKGVTVIDMTSDEATKPAKMKKAKKAKVDAVATKAEKPKRVRNKAPKANAVEAAPNKDEARKPTLKEMKAALRVLTTAYKKSKSEIEKLHRLALSNLEKTIGREIKRLEKQVEKESSAAEKQPNESGRIKAGTTFSVRYAKNNGAPKDVTRASLRAARKLNPGALGEGVIYEDDGYGQLTRIMVWSDKDPVTKKSVKNKTWFFASAKAVRKYAA